MVRGPGAAMTRPLLWSAAGHLMVLSACLLIGAGRGPVERLLPVVEVLLVGREPGPAGAAASGSVPAGLPRRVAGLPSPPRGVDLTVPRANERPPGVAPTPPAPAAREARTADPAPGPREQPASVPRAGVSAAAAAPGPAVEAAPVFPGIHPMATGSSAGSAGGALFGPAGVPAGRGAGPAGPGGGGERSRSGAEIGLLRERIQSGIVYPEEAVRRGLEGEVVLRIHIETGGVPNEIRVARSSGARLLDDAARRGVVRAAPLPSSPGWVEVPVRFRLR